jgi:hypothetical protein
MCAENVARTGIRCPVRREPLNRLLYPGPLFNDYEN